MQVLAILLNNIVYNIFHEIFYKQLFFKQFTFK